MKEGYDIFHVEVSETGIKKCRVCGSICEFKANVPGPVDFANEIPGHVYSHNLYLCSDRNEIWHDKLLSLIVEKDKFCSPSLKEIIQKDIDKMIKDIKVEVC